MADIRAFGAEMRRQAEDLVSRFMASDAGQRLIHWYDQLGERDRIALRLLSFFLGVVAVYVVVIDPMIDRREAAERRLQDERALLEWLRSHESSVSAPGSAGEQAGAPDQPIATVVNTTAQENKLTIRRYEPAGEDGIRVWLEGVPFNAVVKWLFQLEGSHGIRAAEFTIEREGEAGMVSARLTLRG